MVLTLRAVVISTRKTKSRNGCGNYTSTNNANANDTSEDLHIKYADSKGLGHKGPGLQGSMGPKGPMGPQGQRAQEPRMDPTGTLSGIRWATHPRILPWDPMGPSQGPQGPI